MAAEGGRPDPVTFAGGVLDHYRHVCAFVKSPASHDPSDLLDARRLTVLTWAERTHPMVLVGGTLQENPFFVPPEEFLEELATVERG